MQNRKFRGSERERAKNTDDGKWVHKTMVDDFTLSHMLQPQVKIYIIIQENETKIECKMAIKHVNNGWSFGGSIICTLALSIQWYTHKK